MIAWPVPFASMLAGKPFRPLPLEMLVDTLLNRVFAAAAREARQIVEDGIATPEDVDKAMWAGPGLRWAAMGPTMLFHLAAGEGGLAEFCKRYTASFNRWWDDLGVLHLDPDLAQTLVDGVYQEAKGESQSELSQRRDVLIAAMQKATAKLRAP